MSNPNGRPIGPPLSLEAVAELVGGAVRGDGSKTVTGVAPLAEAGAIGPIADPGVGIDAATGGDTT